MNLEEIKQFIFENKDEDIVLNDDVLKEISTLYYDYAEGKGDNVNLRKFLDHIGDYFNKNNNLDIAALCYELALKNQNYGFLWGIFLIQFIETIDDLNLKLARIYLNDNYKKHDPIKATKLLFSYHTDHIAFACLRNKIEDEFNILFKQLSTIEPQMENFDYCYYLGLMYLDGIGTEVDYCKAKPLLHQAIKLNDNQISNTILNYVYDRACRNYKIKHIDDNIKVGDMISYGSYNNRKIIWKVIGEKDNCYILLSNEVLESTYVSNYNVDFDNYKMLPAEEFIKYVIVHNLPNRKDLLIEQEYSTVGDIKEYSYLPKISELKKYIPNDLTATAFPHAYFNGYDSYGLLYDEDTMNCEYLVHNDIGPSKDDGSIGCVNSTGKITKTSIKYEDVGIRPIIYLKKKSV